MRFVLFFIMIIPLNALSLTGANCFTQIDSNFYTVQKHGKHDVLFYQYLSPYASFGNPYVIPFSGIKYGFVPPSSPLMGGYLAEYQTNEKLFAHGPWLRLSYLSRRTHCLFSDVALLFNTQKFGNKKMIEASLGLMVFPLYNMRHINFAISTELVCRYWLNKSVSREKMCSPQISLHLYFAQKKKEEKQ